MVNKALDFAQPKSVHYIVAIAREQVETCELGQYHESVASSFPAIAGYEIVREILRGGQGVVYEAIQAFPNRRVAIKILRYGPAATAIDNARFRREANVLARLRHPNIVSIHETGVVSGNPYFVMDYVAGETIDKHVAHAKPSVKQIVLLFLKVCDAVASAHRIDILHRDLKPGNIQIDESGEPRVLDFGLATEVGRNQMDGSLTITGQFIGTLQWATPEQAAADHGAIDKPIDVYALGLVLFHILTDAFPYKVMGPPSDVLDAIQHAKPMPPSLFRRGIPPDLDCIVLQCLAKEPARRYASAVELAADLRDFLADKPIKARRDTAWYVLAKKIRRHRWAVAVLGVMTVVTIIYAVSITVLFQKATTSERQKNAQYESAKQIFRVLAKEIGEMEHTSGTASSRRKLVTVAYRGLGQLLSERSDDAPVSAAMADILYMMGDFASELGRNGEALEHFTEAAHVHEALVRNNPVDLDLQAALAIDWVRAGNIHEETRDVSTARTLYEKALDIDLLLVQSAPGSAQFLNNLLWSYQRLGILARARGEIDAARSYFHEELTCASRLIELAPDKPASLQALLDAAPRQIPQYGTAESSLGNAEIRLKAAQGRLACTPDDPAAQVALADTQCCMDNTRTESANIETALRPLLPLAERMQSLGSEDPKNMRQVADALRTYAYYAEQAGLTNEADAAIERALTIATSLVQKDRNVVENITLLADLHGPVKTQAERDRDFVKALSHAEAQAELYNDALGLAPDKPQVLHGAFLARHSVASNLYQLHRETEAKRSINDTIDIAERAVSSDRATPEFLMDYGRILTQMESLDRRDINRGLDLMEQAILLSKPSDPLLWEQLGNAAWDAKQQERACIAYAKIARSVGSTEVNQQIRGKESKNP
ncbi:MAG: protein kinase [Planctomycetes bacterium]|nr:protein kinase [Planctomycetota bacterium]MBI3833442.1 protein kinase [Planctomycetota bacterium]